MIKKDPRQDIYDTIYGVLGNVIPGAVYDFIPPKGTPYPFIRIGYYQGDDTPNKTHIFGDYFQMIHFWWPKDDRIGLTNAMLLTKSDLRALKSTPGGFQLSKIDIREQVLPDIDDTIELLHGVLTLTINFN